MIDNEVIICRCEEVTKEEVIKAIRRGANTVNAIKRWTRVGMGLCQGKSCLQWVAKILSEETGKPMKNIKPHTSRPPIRPIKFSARLTEEEDR
ncbi:MAG TPA: (2Fe-2S)-binding protein [Nitrospinota bacterium]|nr:(2Fe-2S)-binding protein [Nitrospinota bacterium]